MATHFYFEWAKDDDRLTDWLAGWGFHFVDLILMDRHVLGERTLKHKITLNSMSCERTSERKNAAAAVRKGSITDSETRRLD